MAMKTKKPGPTAPVTFQDFAKRKVEARIRTRERLRAGEITTADVWLADAFQVPRTGVDLRVYARMSRHRHRADWWR